MNGKQKCSFLKDVRRKIAEANNIPYHTKECTHTGECSGTCPYCESEVRYLEGQLKKKASLGVPLRIVSLCAGMAAAVSGCSVIDSVTASKPSPTPLGYEELSGEVPYPFETEDVETLPTATVQPPQKSEPTLTVPSNNSQPVELIYDELSGYVPND